MEPEVGVFRGHDIPHGELRLWKFLLAITRLASSLLSFTCQVKNIYIPMNFSIYHIFIAPLLIGLHVPWGG